jgi:hypothetical protein
MTSCTSTVGLSSRVMTDRDIGCASWLTLGVDGGHLVGNMLLKSEDGDFGDFDALPILESMSLPSASSYAS